MRRHETSAFFFGWFNGWRQCVEAFLELAHKQSGRRGAIVPVSSHEVLDDGFQRRRDMVRKGKPDFLVRIVQLALDHRLWQISEWMVSDNHLVQHDAEGIEIRTTVNFAPAGLFRRHVFRRAEHLADRRNRHFVECRRNSEVRDFDPAVAVGELLLAEVSRVVAGHRRRLILLLVNTDLKRIGGSGFSRYGGRAGAQGGGYRLRGERGEGLESQGG